MSDLTSPESAKSWNTYWQGTADIGAFGSGGVAHPDITTFWGSLFTSVASQARHLKVLDVATGNGAILDLAVSILDTQITDITCVDISAAAIENVQKRFPKISGIVSDAISMPFENGQFDLVTSQFGVEYAGLDAIAESARLVGQDGQLVLMLHIVDGRVHIECQASLSAIERIQAANFVPLALEFFRCGFAAVRGADRRAYDAAGTQFAIAVQAAEAVMEEFGEGVAGDTISRLYADVNRIHSNLPKYDPDEVNAWLVTMESELEGYAERMQSMINAAIAPEAFDGICETLVASGFKIDKSGALLENKQSPPLAWLLIAMR